MKTAINRVGRGKQRDINARFQAMTNHYLFEPEFCNPASGWEKGQIEKNVRERPAKAFSGDEGMEAMAAASSHRP